MPKVDPTQLYDKIIARLDTVLLLLLRAGLVCGIISLGYLLYGIFSGALFNLEDPNRYSPQKQAQMVQSIETIGTFCAISLITLVACALLRAPDDQDVIVLVIVGGLLVGLGLPLLIGYQARQSMWGHNEATEFLVHLFARTGLLIGVGLGVLLLRSAVKWVRFRPLAAPQAAVSRQRAPELPAHRQATMFSPCWHLPYCRDFLLQICPAFQAKVKCWKFGRGCFCDQGMIDRLVQGSQTLSRQRGQAYARREISERLQVSRGERKKNKPPCGRCFIYLEHQRLKHKVVTPLVYPLTILLVYLGQGLIGRGYGFVSTRTSGLWQKLSFTGDVTWNTPPPSPATAALAEASATTASHITHYIVLVLVGMLLLVLLLRLTETAIFKWKL
jgi:hypothetical protein